MNVLEMLETKSVPEPNTGCWLWLGSINHKGYGFGSFEGIRFGAHRLSYMIHKGEIPKGMLVCHTCDQRSCVNPEHLWIGTAQDNTNDMMKKGRHIVIDSDKGEMNRFAKLKNADVLKIREMGKDRIHPKLIGAIFKITDRNVYDILSGKTWKHLLNKAD